MDDDYEKWFHEDDPLHQAEGIAAVQWGVPVATAARALPVYAERAGLTLRDLVARIHRREVVFNPAPEPPARG